MPIRTIPRLILGALGCHRRNFLDWVDFHEECERLAELERQEGLQKKAIRYMENRHLAKLWCVERIVVCTHASVQPICHVSAAYRYTWLDWYDDMMRQKALLHRGFKRLCYTKRLITTPPPCPSPHSDSRGPREGGPWLSSIGWVAQI